jgi:metal-responsive CopG/Arc/MetJ family transcriptional regulator
LILARKCRTIAISIPEALIKRMKQEAEQKNVSVSELVRQALSDRFPADPE